MRKINKTSELNWLLGVIFVALGVAICSKANLGVSMIAAPAFVVQEAIFPLWNGFSVGMTEYVLQGILLILLCIIIRKFNWKFLLAFLVAFIYGYVLDFFLFVLSGVNFSTVYLRWIMLLIGDCITAFGVACFFRTYLSLQVYELFVSAFSKTYKKNINAVKWIFDITLLVISITLALILFRDITYFDFSTITHRSYHSIGLGTILTTIINSPIITIMGKFIDKIFNPTPLFPKLQKLLSVQE